MPDRDVQPAGRWRLSPRTAGDVLAAQADHRGLNLAAFVSSRSRTPREVEGRLLDIIDGAAVAATRDCGPRTLPPLLHHTLDALLRWREDLARHGDGEPFHVFAACTTEDGLISVACVSGDVPEVEIDGESFDAPWFVAIRRAGCEARAYSIYAGRRRAARVVWRGGSNAAGAEGPSVEAEWRRDAAEVTGSGVFALEEERPGLRPDPSGIATREERLEQDEAAKVRAITGTEAPAMFGVASESTVPAAAWGTGRGPAVVPPVARPSDDRTGEAVTDPAPMSATATAVEVESLRDASPTPAGSEISSFGAGEGATGAAIESGPVARSGDDTPVSMDEEVPVATDDETRVALDEAPPVSIDDAVPTAFDEDAAVAIEDAPSFRIDEDAPPPSDDDAPFRGDEAIVTIEDDVAVATVQEAPAPAAVESDSQIAGTEAHTEQASTPRFSPLRPEWPSEEALDRPRRLRRILPWALGIVVLFAAGWLVGTTGQGDGGNRSRWTGALRAVGLGGAWFDASVTSRPAGAWITVDGKERALRTPATIELEPGTHQVTLALDGLGEATFEVRGEQGANVSLDASLLGSLVVRSTDPEIPIEVSVDGAARGYAPTVVGDLEPGPHTVEFAGPGMTPWGTTVEVRIGEEAETLARPFDSPATGVIEVQAFTAGDVGPVELKGAAVRVDGRPTGVTPLTLELDRGPHSVVVTHGSVTAPVQVIDLPGGNQRFARFSFGSAGPSTRLSVITADGPVPSDRPFPVSASLEGVSSREVREMWLHVGTQDGAWRRYPMAMLEASGAVVGTVVFPAGTVDAKGRAPYYVSATTASGDEYFTELRNVPEPGKGRVSTRSTGARTK